MSGLPEPYYQTDDRTQTIYCGDCLEILPLIEAGSVDLVLTDPPYGLEGGCGGQLRDYRKADYRGSWEDTPEYIKTTCVPAIELCLQISQTVVLTPGTRCACSYPQPDEIGCFFSPASSRIGKFGFHSCHPIFYYGHYKNRGRGALPTGIAITESVEKNGHPCPKPIKAWKWLLERCSNPGDMVLDPFLGSGTSLVACQELGRRGIGIEISEEYCEIAKKRLRQQVLVLKL